MNIATTLNEKYVPYTYVMLYSFFSNNEDAKKNVYLLIDKLSDGAKEKLDALAEAYKAQMHYLHIDLETFDGRLTEAGSWPMVVCFRLQLLDVLPLDVDRILYLDSDVIVNKNIEDFYAQPFEQGKYLIVCHDFVMRAEALERYGERYADAICDLIREEQYFNSGMIVMDVDGLRGRADFSYYMQKAAELEYKIYAPDQDILNFAHKDETQFADEWTYDLFANAAILRGWGYDEVKEQTAIIHYAGGKPWNGGDHIHCDIEKIWWDYAKETVFDEKLINDFLRGRTAKDGVREHNLRTMETDNATIRKEIASIEEAIQVLCDIFQEKTGEKTPVFDFGLLPQKSVVPKYPAGDPRRIYEDERLIKILDARMESGGNEGDRISYIYEVLSSDSVQKYKEMLLEEKAVLLAEMNKRLAIGLEIKQLIAEG